MSQKRVFYAVEQVGIAIDGSTSFNALHGVQSIGMTTNFNLQQIFEFGQISLYENVELIPDVQITATKVLDGYPLMYHRATQTAISPTLVGRSNEKCLWSLAIFPDTNQSANGSAVTQVTCSGLFVSALSYKYDLDNAFTEDMTMVGNNKVWANDPKYAAAPSINFAGAFTTNADAPIAAGQHASRRQDMIFLPSVTGLDTNGMIADPDCTILPPEIFGISNSGTNDVQSDGNFGAHLISISLSTDLGREAINELGRRGPYHRFAKFPTAVTTEVQVTTTSGDMVSATESGIYTTGTGCGSQLGNLKYRTIRVATCDGTRVYAGIKNKLLSSNYSSDTGGNNVAVTYTFQNFNDLTVLHSGDPNTSGTTWWAARTTYLVN